MALTFTHEEYHKLVEDTFAKVVNLGIVKGGEYAGDGDRLANFRRNALDQGLSMEAVWRVYAAKHWDAIGQYVRDLNAGKDRERAEPLAGRADDLIVYLLLFKCMLVERDARRGMDAQNAQGLHPHQTRVAPGGVLRDKTDEYDFRVAQQPSKG